MPGLSRLRRAHLDAVVADAVARGIADFDVETAYAAMVKNATEIGTRRATVAVVSRLSLPRLVPHDEVEHVAAGSRTSPTTIFVAWARRRVPALSRGPFTIAIRSIAKRLYAGPPARWLVGDALRRVQLGGAYIEGSARHLHTDAAGLINLSAVEATVAKLDRMLELAPRFEVFYNCEIHEMTEMGAVDFGQYAHSNQPVHHVLYLYTFAGVADKTWRLVRWVLNKPIRHRPFAATRTMARWLHGHIFRRQALSLLPRHVWYR